MQLSSCLICRIRCMPEQQSKKHVCVFGCVFSVEHTPRPCQGVHFVSLLSLRVLMCFFFSVPSSALFGLSVTAVKHIPIWTAGGVHTPSISPPLRAHVSVCVNVRSRASMRRRVVDPLFIVTAIPLCHQYLICHATCQRRMGDNRPLSPPRSTQRLILFERNYRCVLQSSDSSRKAPPN